MSTTYPIPRQARQAILTATASQTVFGPFDFVLFAGDDVQVRTRAPAALTWTLIDSADYTVAPAAPYVDYPALFTVTFDTGLPVNTQVWIKGARLQSRVTDVTQGGAVRSLSLEKELDRESAVLQEVRRDIDALIAGGATGELIASGVANDSPAPGGTVALALEGLDTRTTAGEATLIDHEARIDAVEGAISNYGTIAEAATTFIGAGVDFLRIAGYYAAGDGGAALYKKVGADPGTLGGKFQSADGAWWQIAETAISLLMYGAIGDGSIANAATNAAALRAALETGRPIAAPFSIPGYHFGAEKVEATSDVAIIGQNRTKFISSVANSDAFLRVTALTAVNPTIIQDIRFEMAGAGRTLTFTVTIATPGVATANSHALANDTPVFLSSTGALPTGLTPGDIVYVKSAAANTLQFSATPGGAAINTSGSQSGIHTLHTLPAAIRFGTASSGVTPVEVLDCDFYNCVECVGDEYHASNVIEYVTLRNLKMFQGRGPEITSRRSRGFLTVEDIVINRAGTEQWPAGRFEDIVGLTMQQWTVQGGNGGTYSGTAKGLIITGKPGGNASIWLDTPLIDSTNGPGIEITDVNYVQMLWPETAFCLGNAVNLSNVNKGEIVSPICLGANGLAGAAAGANGITISASEEINVIAPQTTGCTGNGIVLADSTDCNVVAPVSRDNLVNGIIETGASDRNNFRAVELSGNGTQYALIGAASSIDGVSAGSIIAVLPKSGGTGLSSYTLGDLIYASGAAALAKLADVATGNALISGGVGAAPSYGKIGLATHVSGLLPLANGGLNANLTASLGGIFYATASAGAILAPTATARQMLQSGASAAPAWSTATYPATTSNKQLLVSTADNVVGELATANSGVLATNTAGTPVITSTPSIVGALDGGLTFNYQNTSTGVNAYTAFRCLNDAGNALLLGMGGTNLTLFTNLLKNRAFFDSPGASAGLVLNNEGANATIIATSSTEKARFVNGLMVGTTTDLGNGTGNFTGMVGIGSFTVGTLPAGSAAGQHVFASNCRVFNGAGTQEGAGVGTGGLVSYNGTAWKIAGTNITAVA